MSYLLDLKKKELQELNNQANSLERQLENCKFVDRELYARYSETLDSIDRLLSEIGGLQ